MVGSAGLVSAQVSNFTGMSGAVNLSAASTNLKLSPSQYNLGGDNWLASFQGAYGIELSNSSVLGMGLTYAAGKSKSGTSIDDNPRATDDISLKNQYSLYLEPGSLLSDNTLLYGKISLEKGKAAIPVLWRRLLAFSIRRGQSGVAQAPADMQGAGCKQHQAQQNFNRSKALAGPSVALQTNHPFSEIKPHHQTDPAVGVHAVFQQTRQGNAQGQGFECQPRTAGAQRGKPQLPHQREND